jgi:hypothetical protein
MRGVSDEVFNRFVDLCNDHSISPAAEQGLSEFLYEIYYLGYDDGYSRRVQQDDLKIGIANWKAELNKQKQ